MRTFRKYLLRNPQNLRVGMKPLSERDENQLRFIETPKERFGVGMKPLSERDENHQRNSFVSSEKNNVGMKPLSERDENPNLDICDSI